MEGKDAIKGRVFIHVLLLMWKHFLCRRRGCRRQLHPLMTTSDAREEEGANDEAACGSNNNSSINTANVFIFILLCRAFRHAGINYLRISNVQSPSRKVSKISLPPRAMSYGRGHGAAWRCYMIMHCWTVVVLGVFPATRPNNIKGEHSSLHRRIKGRTLGFIGDIVQQQERDRDNLRRLSSRDHIHIHRRIDHFSWRRRRRRCRRSIVTSTNELFQLRNIRNDDIDGEDRSTTTYPSRTTK